MMFHIRLILVTSSLSNVYLVGTIKIQEIRVTDERNNAESGELIT